MNIFLLEDDEAIGMVIITMRSDIRKSTTVLEVFGLTE